MADVQVKEIEAMRAMALPFTGDYADSMDHLDRIMGWLLRTGHPYSQRPMMLCHDDPAKVPAGEQRGEICMPIEEVCEGTGDFVNRDIPAATVACMTYEGDYSQSAEIYPQIFDWIRENGYTYVEDEPTREIFVRLEEEDSGAPLALTEVQVPIEGA